MLYPTVRSCSRDGQSTKTPPRSRRRAVNPGASPRRRSHREDAARERVSQPRGSGQGVRRWRESPRGLGARREHANGGRPGEDLHCSPLLVGLPHWPDLGAILASRGSVPGRSWTCRLDPCHRGPRDNRELHVVGPACGALRRPDSRGQRRDGVQRGDEPAHGGHRPHPEARSEALGEVAGQLRSSCKKKADLSGDSCHRIRHPRAAGDSLGCCSSPCTLERP
jgi:hypothetical protein